VNWLGVSVEELATPLVWLLKLTLVFGLAWMAATLLARKSAATRHRVWVAGVLGALMLPVVAVVVPVQYSGSLGTAASRWVSFAAGANSTGNATAPAVSAQVHAARSGSVLYLLASIWAFVLCLLLLRLFAGLLRLSRIAASSKVLEDTGWPDIVADLSRSLGVKRRVRVLLCRNPAFMPVTWGIVRPRVMLPSDAAQWPPERRRIVLAHELAHVSRHDWLLQMCAEVMCCVYWFHPLAWFAARKQRQESEHASDDAVLNIAIPALDYANELLEIVKTLGTAGKQRAAALAIVRVSDLERRFEAMMANHVNRNSVSNKAKLLIGVVACCLLVPVAVFYLPAQVASSVAPRGWFLAGSERENYTSGVDPATMYQGHSSGFLKSKPGADKGFGTLMQTFSVGRYAGHRLRLTATVKSADIETWAGLWMRVDQGSSMVAFDNMQNRAIKGTTDWQDYSVVLNVPPDATDIAFGVLLEKSGTVWLSNIRFEIVGDDVPVTGIATPKPPEGPTNLGFEQ
jgi:beta-lactamase regulating signal transducer with metallopeptidase domain